MKSKKRRVVMRRSRGRAKSTTKSTNIFTTDGAPDKVLFGLVVALTLFGLLMIASAV